MWGGRLYTLAHAHALIGVNTFQATLVKCRVPFLSFASPTLITGLRTQNFSMKKGAISLLAEPLVYIFERKERTKSSSDRSIVTGRYKKDSDD
ncbi:hypothetical protein OUZ56_028825 [Daphnia magna]|uniref:Uncharacterized protein n=1 Tax=Daphnia magna TaxID=35525 RepID=A0ABR0B528_9CRUS|nr:hypothetical protein OUZ56_028825 [Daphnia magna]